MSDDLDAYIAIASRFKRFDATEARRLALAAIRYYGGSADVRDEMAAGQALERRWYASLTTGEPDYSVYDDEFFVSDVWACWIVYSRKYLKKIKADDFPGVASVADLGCGVGYTTAALKELFPAATVYGTQLPSSFQSGVASTIGITKGFTVHPEATGPTDLVFASEYFEHFQRPIEHLFDVLRKAQPKYLVIANSFGSRSVGHFDEYLNGDEHVSNKKIGRAFNEALRSQGYVQVETGFWNNRPMVWKR